LNYFRFLTMFWCPRASRISQTGEIYHCKRFSVFKYVIMVKYHLHFVDSYITYLYSCNTGLFTKYKLHFLCLFVSEVVQVGSVF
jgi:hypothetical protein